MEYTDIVSLQGEFGNEKREVFQGCQFCSWNTLT